MKNSLVVWTADKGSPTAILNRNEYIKKTELLFLRNYKSQELMTGITILRY